MDRMFRPVLLLTLILLCSCSRPMSVEKFVKADGSSVYEFTLDMSDTLHAYDLSFYSRIEGKDAPTGFPMKVYLTSPSGQTYGETVYFRISEGAVSPYRTALVPVEPGIWTMSVSAEARGLCGMGLICTKTDF